MKVYQKSYINLCTILFFLTLPLLSIAQIIHTEKADATFAVNEPVTFIVTDTAGGDFTGGDLAYEIYLDATGEGSSFTPLVKLDSGVVNVPMEGTEGISFTYDQPGVISCRIIRGLNDQDPIASAAYAPFEIQQLEEEGDFLNFDSFWTLAKNQLALVDMVAVLTGVTDTFLQSDSYKIELGNINGRKVHGILTIPKSDGPYGAGPYPAMVQLPPYGDNLFDANGNSPSAAEITGIVHLNISIHNTETNIQDPNAYLPKDNLEFADSNYYKQAILAGVRAIDYLYSRTDVVDTSRVGVMGVSQGGGLAVMVAGVDSRVKYLMASNPASSEHLGEKFDVATGYPKFLYHQGKDKPNATEYERQKWLRNVKYYDAINFAKRYHGPASIFVGYEDVICPARGTFAVFNALRGSKILAQETNQGHNHGVYSNSFPTWIARHLDTEAEFAFGSKGYYINLGVDREVPFGKKVALKAVVEHDHFGYDADFTYEWSQVDGVGNVIFSNPTLKTTNITFSRTGKYKVQLKAVDKSKLVEDKYFFTLIDEVEFNVVDVAQCNPGNNTDKDGDGVCATTDCDDNNPNVPASEGTPCNDYDSNTANDVIQADGCTCIGSQRLKTTGCIDDILIEHGNGQITVSGQNGKTFFVKAYKGADIYEDPKDTLNEIHPWCAGFPCNNHEIPNLPEGDYIIQVFDHLGYNPDGTPIWGGNICWKGVFVSPTEDNDIHTPIDPNNDGDGTPASQDWDDYNVGISSFTPGNSCPNSIFTNGDGDPNTTGDYIRDDGFTCAGNYVDPCPTSGGDADKDGVCDNIDCNPNDPTFPKEINTPCDDGDFNTKNDVYIDGCTCQGEPIDTTNTGGGTPPLTNSLWTLSNDGHYIYRDGKTETKEFWTSKLMVEANLSSNSLLEGNNQLMPLEGLRGYIEQNRHLPNIPKATTVINSGLNVGLLSVLRMQKIEELTAYLLEMNKRLVELEEENDGLEREFNDCQNVTVTGSNNSIITVDNIPINAKVDYIGTGTGWNWVVHCDGNCSTNETISGLANATDYKVRIAVGDPWCQEEYSSIVVSDSGGSTDPCANAGGDTDGDGVCDNNDVCSGHDDNIDTDGDGIPDGCDTGGGNTGGGTPTDCNGVTAIDGGLSVEIGNIPSAAQIDISGPSTGWALQEVCNGNCNITETVSGLTVGTYQVKIQTFNPDYCYNQIDVTVTTEGSNTGGGNTGGGGTTQQDTTTVGLWTANNTENYIYRDGKVMVMDTFMAEKIIVEVLNFPDYVFAEDYQLIPLDELQQYIATNKHLPNIPKGANIEQEGMNIGDISVLQMEKIEELTLYLLEMNERLKRLEATNQQLRRSRKNK